MGRPQSSPRNFMGTNSICSGIGNETVRCLMFSYHRDEFAALAVRRALGQTPDDGDDTLAAVCRHLGRVIVGWLLAIIVIELAVKYWWSAL